MSVTLYPPRPAALQKRSKHHSVVRHQIRCRQNEFAVSRVDQSQDHLQEAVFRLAGARWNDLHIRHAYGLCLSQAGAVDQFLQWLAGLKNPIADQDSSKGIYYCAFDADHRINQSIRPLSIPFRFEVARIDQVHASRPRHHAINHHDFPVQTKIRATDQGTEQPGLESGTNL